MQPHRLLLFATTVISSVFGCFPISPADDASTSATKSPHQFAVRSVPSAPIVENSVVNSNLLQPLLPKPVNLAQEAVNRAISTPNRPDIMVNSACGDCAPYCTQLNVTGFVETLEPESGFQRPCPTDAYLFKGSESANISQIRNDDAYLGFFGCLEDEIGLCTCTGDERCYAAENASTSLDLFAYCEPRDGCNVYAVVFEGRLVLHTVHKMSVDDFEKETQSSSSARIIESPRLSSETWYPDLGSVPATSLKIVSITCQGCPYDVGKTPPLLPIR